MAVWQLPQFVGLKVNEQDFFFGVAFAFWLLQVNNVAGGALERLVDRGVECVF